MEKEYLQKVPEWYKTKSQDLILTDDIDSLVGCSVIKMKRQAEVSAFYDFNTLYYTGMYKWQVDSDLQNELIGVDCGLTHGKTYDNHVQQVGAHKMVNMESINFNVIDNINSENYFDKYCGSTAIMLWSLFGIPLPESEDGKMILLAIDSTFLGFYSSYESANRSNKHYIVDVMQFPELYEVLKRHTRDDFEKIINKYNLRSKIVMKDSRLTTKMDIGLIASELGIDIELPEDAFLIEKEFTQKRITLTNKQSIKPSAFNSIYSIAVVRRNSAQYSAS